MSAERLREAAALMRSRAADALLVADNPWIFRTLGWSEVHGTTYSVETVLEYFVVAEATVEENAIHLASWHPAVALLAADAFDQHADIHDSYDCQHYSNGAVEEPCAHMLAANAYLGSPS